MTKRVADELDSFKYNGEPVRFTIGTLALMCFSIILIVVSTFTQVPIVDLFALNKGDMGSGILLSDYLTNSAYYAYIPQLPAIFFVVALLDRRYGIAAIIMYIWVVELIIY